MAEARPLLLLLAMESRREKSLEARDSLDERFEVDEVRNSRVSWSEIRDGPGTGGRGNEGGLEGGGLLKLERGLEGI